MTMQDTVESFANCTIQHGPSSDRVYLMHVGQDAPDDLATQLIGKADTLGYSKIFAKIPDHFVGSFMAADYQAEAHVTGFYCGTGTAHFMCKYLKPSRAIESNASELDAILDLCRQKNAVAIAPPGAPHIRACTDSDAVEMAALYQAVFPSYPFPINDAEYVKETMHSHVDYFAIEQHGQIVSLASAEMDGSAQNAEMTDFATLPEFRGNGFGLYLLQHMERAVVPKGIRIGYTIARAVSPGMNVTFAKAGYRFGGRLKNNTQISGQIESMNVWFKPLNK